MTRITRSIALTAGLLILLALAAAGLGYWYYFGPLPRCRTAPVRSEPWIQPLDFLSPAGQNSMGTHSDQACPDARRSYVEYYYIDMRLEDYLVFATFTSQGSPPFWSIAGFVFWEAKDLRWGYTQVAVGRDSRWARRGLDVSLMTRSPRGGREKSFLTYHDRGPRAGQVEVKIFTRDSMLHAWLKPVGPGLDLGLIGEIRGRPGTWNHYSAPFLLAEVEATFWDYSKPGPPKIHRFPSPGKRCSGYLEHLWGQMKFNDSHYTWGQDTDLSNATALLFGQQDLLGGGVGSFIAVTRGREIPVRLVEDPPLASTTMPVSRPYLEDGLFFPQLMHVWGMDRLSRVWVRLDGFLEAHVRKSEWRVFQFFGQAATRSPVLDWSKPRRVVTEVRKGEMPEDETPSPLRGLESVCDPAGCLLRWTQPACAKGRVRYWVFRSDAGDRAENGEPVGVVEQECAGHDQTVAFADPVAGVHASYRVVPVSVPETTLHHQPMAGYERSTLPPQLSPQPEPPDPRTQGLRNGGGQPGLPGPGPAKAEHRVGELKAERDPDGNAVLRLVSGSIDRVLGPRFSPAVQLQALDWAFISDQYAVVAWAERCAIKGDKRPTDWEVFAAVTDLGTGSFRVFPVSMSDADDLSPEIETHYGGRITVRWQQCRGDECRAASQSIMTVDLR